MKIKLTRYCRISPCSSRLSVSRSIDSNSSTSVSAYWVSDVVLCLILEEFLHDNSSSVGDGVRSTVVGWVELRDNVVSVTSINGFVFKTVECLRSSPAIPRISAKMAHKSVFNLINLMVYIDICILYIKIVFII